jgi:hypothetical protein
MYGLYFCVGGVVVGELRLSCGGCRDLREIGVGAGRFGELIAERRYGRLRVLAEFVAMINK